MIQKFIEEYFYLSQIAVGAVFLLTGWLLIRPGSSKTFFKDRKSDPTRNSNFQKPRPRIAAAEDPLANARYAKQERLALTGIRIDGAPHEVLGVTVSANQKEIQKAYRELMRRYHPDQVARPGTRAWQDAQKIAEAINQAKDSMLARFKSTSAG